MFFGKLYKTALERRRQLTIFFVAWLFDIDDLDVVSELVRDCSVFEMSYFSNSRLSTHFKDTIVILKNLLEIGIFENRT